MNGMPPPEVPVIEYKSPVVIEQCIAEAAQDYKLHPLLIKGILNVEGGKIGTISKNTNGSYDLGPMQINTIWLKTLSKNSIDWKDLTYNACVNIQVGSWILANELRRSDDFWKGVGNYNSRTPRHNKKYRTLVYGEVKKLMASLGISPRKVKVDARVR